MARFAGDIYRFGIVFDMDKVWIQPFQHDNSCTAHFLRDVGGRCEVHDTI